MSFFRGFKKTAQEPTYGAKVQSSINRAFGFGAAPAPTPKPAPVTVPKPPPAPTNVGHGAPTGGTPNLGGRTIGQRIGYPT